MRILAIFTTLRIKPGFTLHAYEFSEGGDGNGVVWAMPSGTPLPRPDDCPRMEDVFLRPPKPIDALDDIHCLYDLPMISTISFPSPSFFCSNISRNVSFSRTDRW